MGAMNELQTLLEPMVSFDARRRLVGRTGTPERVADLLRFEISDGHLPPGTRLSEEALGETIGVSRNTLREAFRMLCHERLLVHEFNRGVFVRTVTSADIADIFKVRRVLEFAALRSLSVADKVLLDRMDAAIAASELAASEHRWADVGPHNNDFHVTLVASLGSRRFTELLDVALAEIRLAFWQTRQPLQPLYEPYVALNRALFVHMKRNELTKAEAAFEHYFKKSERELTVALEQAGRESSRDG
jgi:DNA-binding GntR family transcriptional regulator